jgi:hypothetical protein
VVPEIRAQPPVDDLAVNRPGWLYSAPSGAEGHRLWNPGGGGDVGAEVGIDHGGQVGDVAQTGVQIHPE